MSKIYSKTIKNNSKKEQKVKKNGQNPIAKKGLQLIIKLSKTCTSKNMSK